MVFGEFFQSALAKKAISPSHSTNANEKDETKDDSKPEKKSVKEHQSQAESRKRRPDDRNDRKNSTPKRPRSHTKKPLSVEAIELTKQLQEYSRQKRLDQALRLYWSRENNSVRDAHHACILVDCCARCGNVKEAEKIIEAMRDDCNVETNTALIKAYAHSGHILQAIHLFRKMSTSEEGKPNVRTLNTLLRGCLWSASASVSVSDRKDELCGGVVSSEEAWELFIKNVGTEHLDISSYEYSAVILCQALRTDDALERIQQLQSANGIAIKGKASISGGDQASLEGLAVVNIALARAHALLGEFDGMWSACQRVFSACKLSRSLLLEEVDATEIACPVSKRKLRKQQAVGGKRAWKKVSEDSASMQRKSSNNTYRNHRLSEIENEAKELVKLRKQKDKGELLEQVRCGLLKRLFYFVGGGTTDALKNTPAPGKTAISDFSSPIWYSFGLAEVMQATPLSKKASGTDPIASDSGTSVADSLGSHGVLDLTQVFGEPNLPVDVEIGAGFGDWIVRQTRSHHDRNHIAVELRADRVAQIFAKGVLGLDLSSSSRLCVVGSDAGSFLDMRLPKGSISTFFANHPEPPTQTFGENNGDLRSIVDGGPEPAHMLNSATIIAMANCLRVNGRIVIVTDNRWYARLLSMTALRALLVLGKEGFSLKSESSITLSKIGFSKVDTFSSGTEMIELFEGQPNEKIGHVPYDPASEGGASYFDRLWRSGGGSHSERKSRFILVLQKSR